MAARFICFLVCLTCTLCPHHLFAQHNTVEKALPPLIKKDIYFIVRKADIVQHIAIRFHLPARALIKLNHPLRKKQTLYAGKKLLIPVWLKRTASPGSADFNIADYTLDTDSLDDYIREDFVSMADIENDTIRRIIIDRDVRKIDRRAAALTAQLDSIEDDSRKNMSNRDARKLPMDRARRLGNFKVGLQLDSLTALRKKILEEKSKINLRLADYEYLVDNASYMASHRGKEDNTLIQIQQSWDYPVKKTGNEKKKTNKQD